MQVCTLPRVRIRGPEEVLQGVDYSDDERHFLTAMERYKRERRRPFPTWREVLAVVHSLGYRRVAEPGVVTTPKADA